MNPVRWMAPCLITGLVLVLLAGCTVAITPPAPRSAPPAESAPVAEVAGAFEVVQLVLDFAPGTWTPPHTHGGPGMVSVVEGEITVRDAGKETIFRTGDSWIELPGQFLEVGNAGATPARTAVVFLLPTGASLTTVQEGVKMDQMPPGPTVTYQSGQPVSEPLGEFETVQLVLDFAAGAWTPPHTHGGMGLVTVVEGEITVRDAGKETIFRTCDSWVEFPGQFLEVGNAGDAPARTAVVFLLPTGASLTTAQEGVSTDQVPPGPTVIYQHRMAVTSVAAGAAHESTYTPRYEPAACQYPIPAGEVIECGYLIVQADRSQPAGPTIRLHVVNFKSKSANPAPDPLFIAHGGPAAPGSIIMRAWTAGPASTLRADRDNIYLEYRGTNFSEPAFYCPEMEADLAQFAGMTFTEEIEWSAAAIRACGERLAQEGSNLSAYSAMAAAADLADLRIALGYDEINVYGISFGTRVAMLMMAYHPEGIRSLILDSVLPLETNWLNEALKTASTSFHALFAACAADPACDAAYPDLEHAFSAVLATLRAAPVSVTVADASGGSQEVLVDDLKFAQFIRDGTFFAASFTGVPAAIYAAYAGDYQAVAQAWLDGVGGRHGETGPGTGSRTQGVYYSMWCPHDGSFTDLAQAKAGYDAIGGDPSVHDWAVASVLLDLLAACAHWPVTAPEPNVAIQAVDSDLPVLMLVGAFDPSAPPLLSQPYADRLANGYYYELPFGHLFIFSPCGMSLAGQFLAHPDQAPAASCIDEMTPAWVLPE